MKATILLECVFCASADLRGSSCHSTLLVNERLVNASSGKTSLSVSRVGSQSSGKRFAVTFASLFHSPKTEERRRMALRRVLQRGTAMFLILWLACLLLLYRRWSFSAASSDDDKAVLPDSAVVECDSKRLERQLASAFDELEQLKRQNLQLIDILKAIRLVFPLPAHFYFLQNPQKTSIAIAAILLSKSEISNF